MQPIRLVDVVLRQMCIFIIILLFYGARLCVCPSKGCLFDNYVATRSIKDDLSAAAGKSVMVNSASRCRLLSV